MAASLLRSLRSSHRVFNNWTLKQIQVRTGFIVLLPEVPIDTAEANPLLHRESVPRFNKITPENCAVALGKTVLECESGLIRIEEMLQKCQRDFDSIIVPLERLVAPLDYAWSTVKNLVAMNNTPEMVNVYNNFHLRVLAARTLRFQSPTVYHAMREVSADQKNLNEAQQRVINKYLLEARLNGLDLTGYNLSHFQTVSTTLAREKEIYRRKIRDATRRFNHTITDYAVVREFPSDLLRHMAVDSTNSIKGPWNVTLQPHIFHKFLQYCSERDLRWNVWQAYNSRGSSLNDSALSVTLQIEEIRIKRRDQAKLLGYPTYVDLSMETKMAGSIDNVQSMIASLKVKSKPAMEENLSELQEFAESRGFDSVIEPWDVPYWRRKHSQQLYGLNTDEIRNYFPLPHVMQKLFDLSYNLFGVSFKDCTSEVELWNEDVTYYKIYNESDSFVASFYLDPYFRNQKIATDMMELGINRCDASGISPIAFLTFNFSPPANGMPSLLNMEELSLLFKKFGNVLQHTLTTMPYSEVAGLTNIEWDAVDICAFFMGFWLLDAESLQSISSHHKSQEKLSEDKCNTIIEAMRHLKSYDLTKELYLSALDLELYSNNDFWYDITKRLWPQFMPFPLDKRDLHTCSFTHIFCDEYPAAYYSSTWSEMIAADVFSAFQEVGLGNVEDIRRTGKRFRETFLALGGGCHPSEIFRRFRGRDPSPDALLKLAGID